MNRSTQTRRVFFLRNPGKPASVAAIDELLSFAKNRCTVVGSAEFDGEPTQIEQVVDRVVVLGGDGTLIGVARTLGSRQIPLIGVNTGKLGFLAEFSVAEFKDLFDRAVGEDSLIRRRTMLQVTVQHDAGVRDTHRAVNDCVIQAGPPFRMINLGVFINGEHLTDVRGDGLIVSTPSGSTAHSLSAGGPIMEPDVDALILTPLSPHSLTHKPLVIESQSVIEIHAVEVNEGTSAIIDGQIPSPLRQGDRVVVKRFETDFMVVRNPLYARWHKLVTKLHWGRAPSYDG